jgi:hypothetical protein
MWIQGSQVCCPNLWGCARTSTKVEDLKIIRTQNLRHSSCEWNFFNVADCNFSNFYLFMFNTVRCLNSDLATIL